MKRLACRTFAVFATSLALAGGVATPASADTREYHLGYDDPRVFKYYGCKYQIKYGYFGFAPYAEFRLYVSQPTTCSDRYKAHMFLVQNRGEHSKTTGGHTNNCGTYFYTVTGIQRAVSPSPGGSS